jgi:FMN phosphatase YigB (HAD superfamily)
MVGNDLFVDIAPAKEAGMKTALFTGDEFSFFNYEEKEIVPDIAFNEWMDFPEKISFYSEGRS